MQTVLLRTSMDTQPEARSFPSTAESASLSLASTKAAVLGWRATTVSRIFPNLSTILNPASLYAAHDRAADDRRGKRVRLDRRHDHLARLADPFQQRAPAVGV